MDTTKCTVNEGIVHQEDIRNLILTYLYYFLKQVCKYLFCSAKKICQPVQLFQSHNQYQDGFDINKNQDTKAKKEIYYFYYKINSFINDYYKNWSPADRLKKFSNNLLIMINELANKICNLDLTEYNEEIPDELLDKVFTMTIYNDPVIAVDGFTYERSSIIKWFNTSNKSPTSGQVLETLKLYPNYDMRSRCIEWKEKYKK